MAAPRGLGGGGRYDLRIGKHLYHNHKGGMAAPGGLGGGGAVVTCELGSIFTTITRLGMAPPVGLAAGAVVTCESGSTITTITRERQAPQWAWRWGRCDLRIGKHLYHNHKDA